MDRENTELVDSDVMVSVRDLHVSYGDREILHAVFASSEDAVRGRLALDNWHRNGMLRIKSIERWTILLDGRNG